MYPEMVKEKEEEKEAGVEEERNRGKDQTLKEGEGQSISFNQRRFNKSVKKKCKTSE